MYQIILLGILLIILYGLFSNMRGWNGEIIELPAYNLSLIRKKFSERNAIVIRNFLQEPAKQEYDELYETLQSYDSNTDVILRDTTLSQIEECVNNIPIAFSSSFIWPHDIQYSRILNTETKLKTSKNHSLHAICPIQSMTLYLQSRSDKTTKKVTLQTGDLILFPKRVLFGFEKGTIDYFNYYK